MKVGVSLAGGGIRGIAHVGVLKALEENNIKVRDLCNIREKASPLLHGHIARLSSAGLR